MRSPTRSSSWRRAALAAAILGATALGAERTGDFSPYPNPDSGNVTDIAGVLTPEQHDNLERSLSDLESRTGTEIVVLIIRTLHEYPGTKATSIEDFTHGLYKQYRIGDRLAGDSMLLVVAVADRKAHIELGPAYAGRDGDAGAIMQDVMVPRFKEGDYAGGISAGVEALASEFAGVTLGFPWRALWVVVGSIAAALISLSLVMSGKRGWGWVVVGLVLVFAIGAIWMAILILKWLPTSRHHHHHGGFFGGSGWGFSSGGFGGGFSGGGGTTGSW